MTVQPIRYTALTYGTASQNLDGTWTPPNVVGEQSGEWGTLRIEAGAVWDTHGSAYAAAGSVAVKVTPGTDITQISGVPLLVESLTWTEPYGEATASFSAPRVTPWDDAGAVDIVAGANIDVYRVLPSALAAVAGTAEVPYWHGIIASLEFADGPGIQSGLSIQAVGALYGECRARAHQPLMLDTALDAGSWIGRSLSPLRYSRPLPPYERFSFESETTNIDIRYRGSRGQSVIDYLDEVLALAKDEAEGTWTISRAYQTVGSAGAFPRARHYYLRPVDTAQTGSVQTSKVTIGGYGIAYSLSIDASETVTAVYGEGVHPTDNSTLSGSRWRNAVYPSLGGGTVAYPVRAGTASTYPIGAGDMDADFTADVVTQVQSQLRVGGWPDVRVTGTWDADTSTALNALWDSIGSAQDSVIASNGDWDLVFDDANGSQANDLGSGFFLPLVDVNPYYLYTTSGDVIGTAPSYDPTLLRVDQTISYGDGVTKARARRNAKKLMNVYGSSDIVGSFTLTSDPVDENDTARSRMDIREGGWLRTNGLATTSAVFVAQVTVQPETDGLPVQLTVSDPPSDLLSLATKLERDRAAKSDPARSFYSQRTQTVRPFRSAVGWDAESGAGLFKGTRSFQAAGSAWTVHKILGAQYGSIEALKVNTSPDVDYCFAVFGGSVSAAALGTVVSAPLGSVTGNYPSWWQHPDNIDWLADKGFIEAWGSFDEPAGYYPGAYSAAGSPANTITGTLEDAGSWTFASLEPPYLWVAVWPRTSGTVTVSGQMKIAVDEG